MCTFIVWYTIEFSRLHNLHSWYWNSLLYDLISSGENSAHFLQLMPFTILHSPFYFHQILITAGWTEAAWYQRLAQHLHTRPAAWREHRSPIQVVLTGLELVTTRPCAITQRLVYTQGRWTYKTHTSSTLVIVTKINNSWLNGTVTIL